jgi:L-fuconolactonase
MRIDAHQHFWDPERFAYPWMPAEPSPLRRAFLPNELRPILARNNFDGCVTVQATTDAGEADWLLALADAHPFILGVVAWVDLTDAQLGATLDRLQRHPKFVGVRHPVHDEQDERWLLRLNVLRSLRELAERRIPFDLLLRPKHLPIACELASKVPSLPLVIDHIAKPRIAAGEFEPWASRMAEAARIPHMHVKMSGMITEAEWKTWRPEHLRPYVQHVWQTFGPERCLFGSDWPVCLLAGIWKEVLAGLTQALGPVPKEIRAGLMGQNAVRLYGLTSEATSLPGQLQS